VVVKHSSLAQPSLCTAKVIRAYFTNGILPEPGTVCQPDVKLFSNETIGDVLAPLAEMGMKRSNLDDDAVLLMAAKQLSRKMIKSRGL
jgi:hypothetical protein